MLMMIPMFEEQTAICVLSSPIIRLVHVALLGRVQNAAFSGISGNF
jgi:hypothetical protein